MSSLQLVTQIPLEKLSSLRDMYLENWPKYYITYFTIDHALKNWKKNGNIQIFGLDDDYEDGSFVCVSVTFLKKKVVK